ncbi:MAG: CHASE2 domain-containing protein [Formosimonas sp.]
MSIFEHSFSSTDRRFLRRLVFEWLVVLLVVGLLVWPLSTTEFVRFANGYVYDRVLTSHERLADAEIVLVAIDDESLAELGRWPWRHSVHASLLRQLSEAKPKAVLFDVLLKESTTDDWGLAEAMRNTPHLASPVLIKNSEEYLGVAVESPAVRGENLGHIVVERDEDGVVRRIHLNYQFQNSRVDALATQVLPETPYSGEYLVPFNVRQGAYTTISYSRLLNGEVNAAFLRDKYVLIGATALGLGDYFITPSSGTQGPMSGVEIQANILDGLKNRIHIQEQSGLLWVFLPLLVLMLGFLYWAEGRHLLWFTSCVFAWSAVTLGAFWLYYVWLPPVATILGLLLAYVLWGWRRLVVIVGYAQREWVSLQQSSTGAWAMLSADVSPSRFRPHDVELSLDYAYRLHEVVTHCLQNLPSGLLVLDLKGQIRLYNQQAWRVVQRVGHALRVQQHVRDIVQILDESFVWRETDDLMWLDLCELNGAAGVFLVHVVPIQHAGHLSLWLMSFVELTAERQAQQERSNLIRFLSHDLRTPQVSILALLDLYPNIDRRARHEISQHVQQTLSWAQDLVGLTQAQCADLTVTEFNWVMLAQAVIDDVHAQARSKNIRIQLQDEWLDELWLQGDVSLLSRAVMNILTNALRYSPVGSCVRVDFAVHAQELILRVSDQGMGLTVEQLANIHAGARAAPHLLAVDAAGSLGVGLNMVFAVMRRHQGRVDISSQVGQGTQVSLILPRPNIKPAEL